MPASNAGPYPEAHRRAVPSPAPWQLRRRQGRDPERPLRAPEGWPCCPLGGGLALICAGNSALAGQPRSGPEVVLRRRKIRGAGRYGWAKKRRNGRCRCGRGTNHGRLRGGDRLAGPAVPPQQDRPDVGPTEDQGGRDQQKPQHHTPQSSSPVGSSSPRTPVGAAGISAGIKERRAFTPRQQAPPGW